MKRAGKKNYLPHLNHGSRIGRIYSNISVVVVDATITDSVGRSFDERRNKMFGG